MSKIPGKGFGLIANRDILAAEIILEDLPICSDSIKCNAPPAKLKKLEESFATYLYEKHPTLDLYSGQDLEFSHKPPKSVTDIKLWKSLLKQILSNAYQIQTTSDQCCLAMFPVVARINHDCNPNCAFKNSLPEIITQDSEEEAEENDEKLQLPQKRVIYALRDIKKDEELTINYLATNTLITSDRKEQLKNWGFECVCSRCTTQGDSELLFALKQKSKLDESKIDYIFDFEKMSKMSASERRKKLPLYKSAYQTLPFEITHWRRCKIRFELLQYYMNEVSDDGAGGNKNNALNTFVFQLMGEELETLAKLAEQYDFDKVVTARQFLYLFEGIMPVADIKTEILHRDPTIQTVFAKHSVEW